VGQAALVSGTQPHSVIKVAGFRKRYRREVAVEGADLEVRGGEIYGLLGPDGAGKSSLLKAIAGVMTFDAGRIDVFGVRLDSEKAAEGIKQRVGFMPQGLGLNLYPELSVDENVDFFARLRLVPENDLRARKDRLLAMTRLGPFRGRAMNKLSGGMKQKLGLICTLIHQPDLLILDEPTTGVDPVSRRDFWSILAELLREHGTTVLVTTAYMDEASRFNRVSLMYDGKILAEGRPEQLCETVQGTVLRLETAEPLRVIDELRRRYPQVQPEGPCIRLFVDRAGPGEAAAAVRTLLDEAGIGALRLEPIETELDDAFTALLRQREGRSALPGLDAVAWPGSAARPSDDARAIRAREISRRFGDFTAVDHVTFDVREGEIFGLLGANGAGKTTVIKMLTGIMPPTSGGGSVAGADLARLGRAIKRRIGYMSQQFSLYTDLTAAENMLLYAGIYGLSRAEARERCRWIADMAGLSFDNDDRTADLPVGIRQRLALGCALVHRPRVLFLDEATSGIDPIGRQQFWRVLLQLSREEGVAILVTTHYMSEAEHCDHLALMHAGRIVADAPPATLKREVEEEAGQLLEIDCEDPGAVMDRLMKLGFGAPTLFGHHVHLFSKFAQRDAARIGEALGANGRAAVHIRELSMDDVFVHKIRHLEQSAIAGSAA
jgi:ABC-type multidrug transport system ATPase subunit